MRQSVFCTSIANISQQWIYRDESNSGHMQIAAFLLPAVINLKISGAEGGRLDDYKPLSLICSSVPLRDSCTCGLHNTVWHSEILNLF